MKHKKIDSKEVKELLSWVETLAYSSPKFRVELKKQLLQGIKEYDEEIYKDLTGPNYDLIGITPNISYYRIKGSAGSPELTSQWVHPFGTPSLLYHCKDSPILIITNPSLRYNSNVIKEIELNNYNENVVGITS